MIAPVLITKRLILRGPQADDAEAVISFAMSERAQFVGGPMDRWTAARGFAASIGHWVLNGFGFWTLVRKDTSEAVGRVGILKPDGWPEPELGWQTWENGARQGFAEEAARKIRNYASTALGIDRPISFVDPSNEASKRLALRLGAVVEEETELLGTPCLKFRHPSERHAA